MSKLQAVFVDIDNTLITKHNADSISKKDIESLQMLQNQGIYVILATGRGEQDALSLANKIKINDFGKYLIVGNGAKILTVSNEIINQKLLQISEFEEVIDFAIESKYVIKLSNIDVLFTNDYIFKAIASKIHQSNTFKKYEEINFGALEDKNLLKIGLFFWKKSMCMKAFNKLKDNFPNLEIALTGGGYYIEITSKEVSKAHAAKHLSELLNFDLNNSIAFGDSLNDYELFKLVKYGIAMDNSMKELIKISTHQTLSAKNSGVSHFINNELKKLKW